MNAINFANSDSAESRKHDLESAFNDGFHTAANSVSAALVRWLVILWAVVTVSIGTFVIVRAILEYAPSVVAGLAQMFSAA